LVLQGCCPKFYPQTTTTVEHFEVVKEVVRDTVVQVQPDSSILQALIKCDSTGRARLQEIQTLKESARLQQSIKMEADLLPYQPTAITVKTVVDSMGIYLTYKDRFKESTEVREIETIIEKEVNVLHWWQKLLMLIGGGGLITVSLLSIRRI
jgi:predicted membrane-bound spermidine synthase